MNRYRNRRRQRGVTLMELMIVIVVVSILASIAVPTYTGYVVRAHRSAGRNELMATAAALERCFTRLNAYDAAGCDAAAALPRTVAEGHYQIQASTLTGGAFTLQAVPQGRQSAKDTDCKTLTLDSRSRRDVTGGAAKTAAYCWSR
jgi:type IV pilus assembly protein PilE